MLFLQSIIVSAGLVPAIAASPIINSQLQARQAVNCADIASPFDETCWGILNLSSWLNDPVTGWNKTTPTCTGSLDGNNCCEPNEPWTTCFLRLAHGVAGSDCSGINAQTCSYDPTLSAYLAPSIVPQVRYVVKNIYAINNFYTSWYEALQYASSQAASSIPSVINEIDPDKKTNMILSDVLTALTAGLALVGAPEVAAALGLAESTATVATIFVKGLQQSPGIAKAIWPEGTDSSQSIQIGDLQNELSSLVKQTANNINAGLALATSDMPSFVGFASTGGFSGTTPPNLASETDGLQWALRTYILSTAMSHNNWQCHGAVNGTIDVTANTNNSLTEIADVGFDGNGINQNGDLWYSANTNRIYNLGTQNHASQGYGGKVMEDIIDPSNAWSTLPLLLDGGYDCTVSGNNLNTGALVQFNADGTVGFSCMSQVWFCIRPGWSCPIPEVNGVCPFGTCGNLG